MATLTSYDLNGKKLSFANWISNLSPTDTPFVSMVGKEAVQQTLFQWQTDTLAAPDAANAVIEGAAATDGTSATTSVKTNVTQILRKVVKVSDTANALANYGRGRELQYQMEKAGKEIKRDLEVILLSAQAKADGDASTARKTAAFQALVGTGAGGTTADPDTGAIVVKTTAGSGVITEAELFDMTYQTYIAGSSANIIMFHPKYASFFSSLQEKSGGGANRMRMFTNVDTEVNLHVSSLVDPLGQEFKLIPNRFMPQDAIYFFNPADWTQMVLRAPSREKLAKDGSYEKWMIEMEVGLRHRNPYASAVLKVKP